MDNKKCVIYARVSKGDESQDPQNQLTPLLRLAESLGLEVGQPIHRLCFWRQLQLWRFATMEVEPPQFLQTGKCKTSVEIEV